jgi:hypothetical protein
MVGDDETQAGENGSQFRRQRLASWKFDGATGEAQQIPRGTKLDYTVSGVLGSAVDAEHAHGEQFNASRVQQLAVK